jgi:hypothetical protein
MIIYHTMHVTIVWPDIHEMQVYANDIACKTVETAIAESFHTLLPLSIQKQAANENIMDGRFKHIVFRKKS